MAVLTARTLSGGISGCNPSRILNEPGVLVRSIAALVVGTAIASIVYWVGAVIALLAMHGIPLGSPGGPPTRADLLVHLMLAAVGTFAGSSVSMQIGRGRRELHAVALGALLAVITLSGFSKPNNWPGWFGSAMSAACILGSLAAAAISGRKRL